MDFVHLIKDQNSKIIDTSPYLEGVWAHLTRKTEYNLETPTIERRIFMEHLPINLQTFLYDCVQKVQEVLDANNTINFASVKIKYLKSLIYWCLVCGEDQGDLVPLTAAQLYFMLNSFPQRQDQCLFVETIYLAALNAIETALSFETIPEQTVTVIDTLKVLLKRTDLIRDCVTKTLSVLNKIVNLRNQRSFSQFDSDEPSCDLQHGGFLCCKVLLVQLQEDYERNKDVILMILFSLMGCFSSSQMRHTSRENVAALRHNVKHLLKCVYKYETVAECPVPIAIKTLAVHKDFDEYGEMIGILCDLEYSVYTNFCWWIAEGLVSSQPEFRKHLPNIVAPLIRHTHGSLRQEKKDTLVQVLTLNLVKLCGDAKIDIAEGALRNLETVVFLNDNSVKNAVKDIIAKDHEAVLETISKHIDKSWKHKNINRHFVNVLCKLHSFKRNILDHDLTKQFDEVLAEACPMDLRPCMLNLAELLKYCSNQPHISNVVLKLFVRMTINPVSLSNFYAKVLYDVLFHTVERNLDSSNALNVADLLISQHYDHKEVFRKFYSLLLLTPHKLNVLINHKAPENPIALKIICDMLDFTDYKHFEGLAGLTQSAFQQKSYKHAEYLFYALEKILSNLSAPIEPQDAEFLEEFLPALEQEIRIKNLPVSCSSNAIGLLLKLERLMDRNLQIHHIVTELETSLFNKLLKIEVCEEMEMFEICRDLAYLGDFLLLTEETLGERTVSLLRNILKIDNARAIAYLSDHPDVWSLLVAFFTKLSLKHECFVEENVFVLETAFISGSESVRYHALLGLEDLCSFRLNYFQPLVPHVFKFIQEDNPNYLTIVSMRIIKRLINEDYILLDEQQYVAITALLAHKNDYIRAKAECALLESFLQKCKRTIAKFFVPSILYYNRYRHHPLIFIAEEVAIPALSMAQRRRMYKFLLASMATVSQFNVINEMSNEILAKILSGQLINCTDVLGDCVGVIGLFLENLGESGEANTAAEAEALLRALVERKRVIAATKYHDYQMVIKKFLGRLLNVALQIHQIDDLLRPELIKIVFRVTTVLFPEINKIIMEGSEDLRKLYIKFLLYYEKNKDTLSDDDTEIVVELDIAGPSTSYG